MRNERARVLVDIGSTTAIAAMAEIVEARRAGGIVGGMLARQAAGMLDRLHDAADCRIAIEAFCDELQGLVEAVPGIRVPIRQAKRRGRTA